MGGDVKSRRLKLHVKLLSFSWDHEFKILKTGIFPAILGLDFLEKTRMLVDAAVRQFSFGFAPECRGVFEFWISPECRGVFVKGSPVGEKEPFLQNLCDEALNREAMPEVRPSGVNSRSIMAEFPELFSSKLGEASCVPYEIELSDPTPVRSPPYMCAPPKLAIFRKMVDELLEQVVVQPSKSPYASPAFLVPKGGGGFRMVVDYRKVNAKVVFDYHSTGFRAVWGRGCFQCWI
jgi:hypothetical protein